MRKKAEKKTASLWPAPFRWLTLLFVVAFLLSLIAGWISPETFWPLSVMGLFFPWLLLGILLLLFFWAFRRSWRTLPLLICLVLGWPQIRAFIGTGSPNPPSHPDKALDILTFNIRSADHFQKLTPEERAAPLLKMFKLETYEVLALQEFPQGGNLQKKLIDKLAVAGFRHKTLFPGKGLAIFSRLPLSGEGKLPFGNRFNGAIFAETDWQGKKVRIYNVHLQSNKVSGVADQLLSDQNTRLDNKKTWMSIRSMLARFRTKARLRAGQVRELKTHIQQSPYPVIACGDFNDTPQSYTYAQMTSLLKDGFRERGRGFGTTYRGKIPALRIDYLFSSSSLTVHRYKVLPVKVSDHYPVTATFSW